MIATIFFAIAGVYLILCVIQIILINTKSASTLGPSYTQYVYGGTAGLTVFIASLMTFLSHRAKKQQSTFGQLPGV